MLFVYDKNKKMMIVQNIKSSNTISLIHSLQIVEDDFFNQKFLSFVIVSHSSWSFCFWFAFALSRSYHLMICADFKTIKSFIKWFQNDHVLSDRIFWIFSHVWSFYFVLNLCTRKWHSAVIDSIIRKTWWWWSKEIVMINESDDQCFSHKAKECFRSSFSRSHNSFSSNSFVLIMIIISCPSRWSYCAICFSRLFVVRDFMHS
jgi:hypothetical protein